MPKTAPRKYSRSSIDAALEAIASGTSIRRAASQYEIPMSTLYGKVTKKYPVHSTMGPSSILSAEEERYLVEWIFDASERGFPVTKGQLLDNVQKLVTEMKRETPFTENRPGRHWYEAFCRRHPELNDRVSLNLTQSRASATEEKLRTWYEDVSKYLFNKDLLDVDASRVFSCDETGFLLCPKDNVIVRRGAKTVYNIVNVDEKENITTLFMANAAGKVAPPMVMFPYQRVPSSVTENVPPGWSIGKSDKGWMTTEAFYGYVANIFYPWLQENRIELPIVLFIDGHSSHCTPSLSKYCAEAKIELIALFPNATHLLQPLNAAVFQPLKSVWEKTVNDWRRENGGIRFRKEQFAPLLKNAIDSLEIEDSVRNAFRTCGLSPFNADSRDFKHLGLKTPTNAEQAPETTDTPNDTTKFTEFLRIMEQELPVDVLSEFKKIEPADVWNGETANAGLYHFWRRIKQIAG